MNADLVQSLYIDARLKLLNAMKELKYSFDIDTLSNTRRKCFIRFMEEQQRATQQQSQLLELTESQQLQLMPVQQSSPQTTTVQLLSLDENQTVTEVTTYETITQYQPQQSNNDTPIQATLRINDSDVLETMSQDSDEGQLTIALPDEMPDSTDQEVEYRIIPTTTISSNENETLLSITNDYESTTPMYLLTSSEPVSLQFESAHSNSATVTADQVSV